MAKKNVKDQVFAFADMVNPVEEEKEIIEEKEEVVTPVKKTQKIAPNSNSSATSWSGTQGKAGYKLPRMNLAFHPDTYNMIKEGARANRMTYSEFLTMLVQNYTEGE